MPENRDHCQACQRPLPAGWLTTKPCPFCGGKSELVSPAADAARLVRGHPRVTVKSEGSATVYQTRLGTTFGKIWLALCAVIIGGCLVMALMPGRSVSVADRLVPVVLSAPMLLVGLVFTRTTYRVRLSDDEVEVRLRVLGPIGMAWRLRVGERVDAFLAFRGVSSNDQPEKALVVASGGREISFGNLLPMDRKEHLAAAIRDYYRA